MLHAPAAGFRCSLLPACFFQPETLKKRTMNNHIKAFGFDLFNTLITVDPDTLDRSHVNLAQSLRENGFEVDGQKSEVKVVKGEAIGSNVPSDATKDGYTFKCWSTKAEGTGETGTAGTEVAEEM